MFRDGKYLPPDREKAFHWFEKGAEWKALCRSYVTGNKRDIRESRLYLGDGFQYVMAVAVLSLIHISAME